MLSDLVKLAAEKARDAAEEFFKLQNIDMAMKSLRAAKDFNPALANIDDYLTAYKVHELAAKKSTWYEILDINDPDVDLGVIKKQYRRMALTLHPDKNSSVAADGAFKIIQSAMDVLTDPDKRIAYDSRFHSNKRKTGTRPQRAGDEKAAKTSSGFGRNWDSCGHGSSCSRAGGAGDRESNSARAPGHKASDNGFKKRSPPRSSDSGCHGYSVRVERRDGRRQIVSPYNVEFRRCSALMLKMGFLALDALSHFAISPRCKCKCN